jgi:hypothetical protein
VTPDQDVRHRPRRGTIGVLALATFAAVVIPAAVSAPANAATTGNPVLTLQLLGLEVVEHDGFIAAAGPAAVVHTAADLFAVTGDYALFTGPDETGTGYLALTNNNPTFWVELQISTTTVGSIVNDTTDDVGFYTVTGTEGTLADEVSPESTANVPAATRPVHANPLDAGA